MIGDAKRQRSWGSRYRMILPSLMLILLALLLTAPRPAAAHEPAQGTAVFVTVEPGSLEVSLSPGDPEQVRVSDNRGGGVDWTLTEAGSAGGHGPQVQLWTVA